MEMQRPTKMAIVTNNLTPYRNPLFNLVKQKLRGGTLRVFYMREKEDVRSWKVGLEEISYDYKILKGSHIKIGKYREIHLNPSLLFELIRFAPDTVVIGGYNSISCWIALTYANLFNKKAVLWSGSTLTSSKVNTSWANFIRRRFISLCNAYISYGSLAKIFLEHYGAKSNLIFQGCNVGDVAYYGQRIHTSTRTDDDITRLLFVGALNKRKGIKELIQALALVETKNWRLSIAGDGPDKDLLIKQTKAAGLDTLIKFEGFKQKEELLNYYNEADIFILPSLADPFSIVTSEALASGLFTLSSKYDGASVDLIIDGSNGYIIDPQNISEFSKTLESCISSKINLQKKQEIANSVAGKQDIYASAFIKSISKS